MTKTFGTLEQNRLAEMLERRPQVPAGKRGDVEIKVTTYEPGHKFTLVSMRNAVLMRQRPTSITFDYPFEERRLTQRKYGLWMTDGPQEVWQMRDYIDQCYSDVLVGGLGLGVTSRLLTQEYDVDSVTTVERNRNITALVRDYVDTCLVIDDLFHFLRPTGRTYDSAVFDIWQGTGEMVWANVVVPLRRLARGKIGRVLCWNEDEMHGQLRNGLAPNAFSDATLEFIGTMMGYYGAFREVAQAKGLASPKWGMKDSTLQLECWAASMQNVPLQEAVERFLDVSSDAWEQEFGAAWDKYCPRRRGNQ